MSLLLALLTAFAAGTTAATHNTQHQLFDVTTFGAVGDGLTDDGAAVERALGAAAAGAAAGARVTVRFPSLRNAATVFAVRRPLSLNASNSYFEVQSGVTLRWLFDADLSYLDDTSPYYWPDQEGGGGHVQLLDVGPAPNQPRLVNVTLGGGGSLDGSGFMWWPLVYHKWEYCCTDDPATRRWGPYFLTPSNIDGLRVLNLSVLNPPMITFDGPAACSDVEMGWLNISAPWQTPEAFYSHSAAFARWRRSAPTSDGNASRVGKNGTCGGSVEPNKDGTYGGGVRFPTLFNKPVGLCEAPNTDGLDPGLGSHGVWIHDIDIENGDDSIVVKPGWGPNRTDGHDCTRDVLVERVNIFRGMGANIGGMGSGCVQNITFRDITILPSLGGIEIKTEMGADNNSFIRDVLYSNITFVNSLNDSGFPCLLIHSDYAEHGKNFSGGFYPKISSIAYLDVDTRQGCTTPVTMRCARTRDGHDMCSDISFSGLDSSGFACLNVDGCTAANSMPDEAHCNCSVAKRTPP